MRNENTISRGIRRLRRRRYDEPHAHQTFEVSIREVMADLEYPLPVRWML